MRLTEERSRSKFPEGVTIRRGRSSKNTADYIGTPVNSNTTCRSSSTASSTGLWSGWS